MNHALLAPSSAPHWRWCAGSVSLSFGLGDEDTDDSRDGSAAHWVGESIIRSMTVADIPVMIDEDFIDKPAPNGVIVDEKMYDAAYTYATDILKVCGAHGLSRQLQIEQRVTMPDIHEQCWGTPDCWTYDSNNLTLYVWDFKYGHGSVVAFENWQLICYTVGILHSLFPDTGLQDRGITVKMQITQPRCYDGQGPFRTWEIAAVDLRGYVNQLAQAAEAAFSGTGQCVTGPWCKNCNGAINCVAITQAVANIVDHSSDPIPVAPTDVGLAYQLDVLERAEGLLKQRKIALVEDAEHRIRNGGTVPGRRMEQGYGNKAWVHPYDNVVAMGELMGVDLKDKPKLLTPAKAETLLKKNNVDASVISSYYARKPTSMKLVVDDGSKAKQIFSKRSI